MINASAPTHCGIKNLRTEDSISAQFMALVRAHLANNHKQPGLIPPNLS